MSTQRVGPDIWGNWPQWTAEGDVIHGLRTMHQAVDARLCEIRADLRHNRIEIYSEVCSDIDSSRDDLRASMEQAVAMPLAELVSEIRQLAQLLGCSLSLINAKLDAINWSMSKLVGLNEQILDVLRNPLINTARQHTKQGLLWFYQNELELSEAQLVKSLEYDSTNHLAYFHLGHIYMSQSKFDQAVRNFELSTKSARKPEDKANGLSCWAKIVSPQDPNQATRLIAQAIKLCPGGAIYWFEAAVYALAVGLSIGNVGDYLFYCLRRLFELDLNYLVVVLGRTEFIQCSNGGTKIVEVYKSAKRQRQRQQEVHKLIAQYESVKEDYNNKPSGTLNAPDHIIAQSVLLRAAINSGDYETILTMAPSLIARLRLYCCRR